MKHRCVDLDSDQVLMYESNERLLEDEFVDFKFVYFKSYVDYENLYTLTYKI